MKESRKNLLSNTAWFFFANVLLAVIISFRYLKYFDFNANPFLIAYTCIASLSHFSCLIFLPYLALILPCILLFPYKQSTRIIAISASVISISLLILDTFVYDLYRFHINGFVIDMVFGGNFTKIFVFSTILYLKVIGFILFLIGLEILLAYGVDRLTRANKLKFGKLTIGLLIIMAISTHVIHAISDAYYYRPIQKASRFYPLFLPAQS